MSYVTFFSDFLKVIRVATGATMIIFHKIRHQPLQFGVNVANIRQNPMEIFDEV